MKILQEMKDYGHEQLVFTRDEKSGLKAIIAIHDCTLGPALGGTRMWNYASDTDALYDVLRLSRGMTLKNSAAGLNLGGGKAVIIGDPAAKSEEMLKAFGRFVERLNGTYITAEDVNISVADAEVIHTQTTHIAGLSCESGDPSPLTARGVWQGIRAVAKTALGADSLEGFTIAVQGLGKVGWTLCEHLHAEEAKLLVADLNEAAMKRAAECFNAKVADIGEIVYAECDIFSPCALGAVISRDNIPMLHCRAIAGAANNVLRDNDAGDLLKQKGIAYAPDYIINAGGVINVAGEIYGKYDRTDVLEKVDNIYNTITAIISESAKTGRPEYQIAEELAMERIIRARNNG